MELTWVHLCAGVPGLITADMVKEGAAVIDVGINRIHDPKTGKVRLIGDVDFDGKQAESPETCPANGPGSGGRKGRPRTPPVTDSAVLTCRSEGEGGVHHSRSRRRGPDDSQHADEEHCSSGEERPDALKTLLMKLHVSVIE